MERLTADAFFNGSIRVFQEETGYRFSIDAVLLAHHIKPRCGDIIVDLGTGCGIIPLILAYRHPDTMIFGVEIQENLAKIAKQNIEENGLQRRVTIMHQDMKLLHQNSVPELAHIVVCNPPYRRASSGRINPNSEKAIARHEIRAGLADVAAAAGKVLRVRGRFLAIYPAERTADLIIQLQSARIEPKTLRIVYSNPDTDAKLIIIEGIREGRPGMKIYPPLYIYQKNGLYSDEVRDMFI